MLKGILFTDVNFSAPSGRDIHLNNVCETLKLFSEVKVYHPTISKSGIGLLTYYCDILLKLLRLNYSDLDYVWVRSGLISWIITKKAKHRGILSFYDLPTSGSVEVRLTGGSKFVLKLTEVDELKSIIHASVIRVTNHKLRAHFVSKYAERVRDIETKIHVIPIPVDISKYRPKNNFDFKNPSIVFAGSQQQWQGLELIVSGFTMLNTDKANLTLYTRNIPPNIESIIKERKFRGRIEQQFVSHDQFIKLLPNHDIFVIPRPSNPVTEITTPIKLIEAMACGLPIVATSVGGINEYIKHRENGYLVEPGDPKTLAEGISEVISNPKLAREMGENARKFAEEHFDYKLIGHQIKSILEQLMKSR